MALELGPNGSIVQPLLCGKADVLCPISCVVLVETAQGVQLAVRSGLARATEALVMKGGGPHVALGGKGGEGVMMDVLASYLEPIGWEDGRGEEDREGVRGGGVRLYVWFCVWLCILLKKTGRGIISEWEEDG